MDPLFPMEGDFINICPDLRRLGPKGDGVVGTTTDDDVTDEEMMWFSSDLLNYQPLLNDCMLSQVSNAPVVPNSRDVMLSACSQNFNDLEFEPDLLTLINPNMAMTLDKESERMDEPSTVESIKTEPIETEAEECPVERKVQVPPVATVVSSNVGSHPTYVFTYRPSKNSILKPQTIAVSSHIQTPLEVSERLSQKLPNVSKVQIRVMPRTIATTAGSITVSSQETLKSLPLSPPNSDSDGSVSPVRSERFNGSQTSLTHNPSPRPKITTHGSLLSNSMPSGSLFLSEEEERTLISEGYPVPTKWPLTKQEEKILKKIQRKIKNKVSAQESRRKKKDYIDSLEKRLEASNQENSSLKKKVDKLEHGNRLLMSQIDQLKKAIHTVSAQTSTYVMVFVLCFAIFLGIWSPLTSTHFNPGHALGLHGSLSLRNPITSDLLPTGPKGVKESNDYKTPSMKSRTLLSWEDADDSFETSSGPTCYSGMQSWLSLLQLGRKSKHCEHQPDIPSAIPLIVEIHDQNPVQNPLENQTDWKIQAEQKQEAIDRVYVADFITVPVSES